MSSQIVKYIIPSFSVSATSILFSELIAFTELSRFRIGIQAISAIVMHPERMAADAYFAILGVKVRQIASNRVPWPITGHAFLGLGWFHLREKQLGHFFGSTVRISHRYPHFWQTRVGKPFRKICSCVMLPFYTITIMMSRHFSGNYIVHSLDFGLSLALDARLFLRALRFAAFVFIFGR